MRPSAARKPRHGGIRPRLLVVPALWRRRRRRRRRRRLGRQRRRICRGLGSARLRQARLVRTINPAGSCSGQMQPGSILHHMSTRVHLHGKHWWQTVSAVARVCVPGHICTPSRSVTFGAVGQKIRRPLIKQNPRSGMRADAQAWPAPPARPARQPGGCGRRRAHCSCSLAASFSARRRSLRPRSCRVRSAVSAFISISLCTAPGGQACGASAAMQSCPDTARSARAELRAAGQREQVQRHAQAAAQRIQLCQAH